MQGQPFEWPVEGNEQTHPSNTGTRSVSCSMRTKLGQWGIVFGTSGGISVVGGKVLQVQVELVYPNWCAVFFWMLRGEMRTWATE